MNRTPEEIAKILVDGCLLTSNRKESLKQVAEAMRQLGYAQMTTEQEVWVRAWCAYWQTDFGIIIADEATKVADQCLKDFRKRFLPPEPVLNIDDPQPRCPLCGKITKGYAAQYGGHHSFSCAEFLPNEVCQCPDPAVSSSSTSNEAPKMDTPQNPFCGHLTSHVEGDALVCNICGQILIP